MGYFTLHENLSDFGLLFFFSFLFFSGLCNLYEGGLRIFEGFGIVLDDRRGKGGKRERTYVSTREYKRE